MTRRPAIGWIILCLTANAAAAGEAGPGSLSPAQLAAMSHPVEANPALPLGDNRFSLSGPAHGLVFLCHHPDPDGMGAGRDGPWIGKREWYPAAKPTVAGNVAWEQAAFKITVTDGVRTIEGNGLPVSHTTGRYPIEAGDPVHVYDANPNRIAPQPTRLRLPVAPVYREQPSCIGGEVGVMLTGVPLFDAFDASGRDAPAHEAQDFCDGHPQVSGQYHYHSLSRCIRDIAISTVIGFAFDGFPITGPEVSPGRELRSADLDDCHGLTSEVVLDGKSVTAYHYVMTRDFPYSVSCFRGKPATMFAVQPWWLRLLGQ